MSTRENHTLQEQETITEVFLDEYDVAILGGGLAGLTLALQLKKARPSTSILVIEKQKHPVPEAAHKVGESTVEIAAHYLRDILGLKEHLDTQQLLKFGLRFFFSTQDNQDIARRVEFGHATLPPRSLDTYQLDRGRLENMLGEELARWGITFLDNCKVQQILLQPQDAYHHLQIQDAISERKIRARWVVDASGRNSLLKRQLGLAKKVGHHANAAWFRVGYPIDINTWSSDPAWQARIREGERSLSTNHLMGPGYWVWLIPLASGSISIGIVTDATIHPFEEINRFERAMAWLLQHEPQCAEAVKQHLDKIQDFRVMKDYSYSCEQVYSSDRWCLTGEAGVFLDPFYSPGSDMIAIGNGLICDLITRNMDGEDIEDRAAIHNNLFLLLIESWFDIYEQQYVLMDNAQIMTAKIIWDTAVYWTFPGLLYYHDMLRNVVDSPSVLANLARFSELNARMQAFFREWHAIAQADASDAFLRYYDFDFMEKFQKGMIAGLPKAELEAQLTNNVSFIEQLIGQLASIVIEELSGEIWDAATRSQVQLWQADPFLAELITCYRQADREHSINSGWITLGGQKRERQEAAR